ncbi:MAG: rhodanese-like domain-containing protein [Ginsengibacter sp.]
MAKFFLLFITCLFILPQVNAQKAYNEVTLPELLNKLQQKDPNMVVVDVRTRAEYYDTTSIYQQSNIGRIKGAINIPLQDFRKDPSIVHKLDVYKDKDIYVICSHSYRSRVVSSLLLDSGFIHVNNTRGGMTEFFRRYNDVLPYKNDFYETAINYKNIAPAQLLKELSNNKSLLLINISNTPKYFWDSANVVFYKYYPSFKNGVNYNYADSLKILELVKKEKNKDVVLYNNTNYGAAELARWLTEKGISNVSYLVGGTNLFYEYVVNENLTSANNFLKMNSGIHFITPSLYCNQMSSFQDAKFIDLRHDTVFNKITEGAKYNYRHLKNAVNFFEGKGVQEFKKLFPDKKIEHIFVSEDGIEGLELADNLTKAGYKINWIIGGMHRWEWYMNNVETFKCMDYLVN